MIKNIALVIVGLWLFNRLGNAHQTSVISAEMVNLGPYDQITNQWDAFNGFGLGDFGPYGPNAHAPGFHVAIGQSPIQQNPCVCR